MGGMGFVCERAAVRASAHIAAEQNRVRNFIFVSPNHKIVPIRLNLHDENMCRFTRFDSYISFLVRSLLLEFFEPRSHFRIERLQIRLLLRDHQRFAVFLIQVTQ